MDPRSFCLKLSLCRLSIKLLLATENARGNFPSFLFACCSLYKIRTVCSLIMYLSPRYATVPATCDHKWLGGRDWDSEPPTCKMGQTPFLAVGGGWDGGSVSGSFSSYPKLRPPLYISNNKSGILSSIITLLLYFWACQNQAEQEKDYLQTSLEARTGRYTEKAEAID